MSVISVWGIFIYSYLPTPTKKINKKEKRWNKSWGCRVADIRVSSTT